MKVIFILVAVLAASKAKWTGSEFLVWRSTYIILDNTYGMSPEDNSTTEDEEAANEYCVSLTEAIAKDKKANKTKYEYEDKYFIESKKEVEESPEFDIVRDMPKGSALNTEIYGLGSTEGLLDILMKRDDLHVVKAEADEKDKLYVTGDYYKFDYNPPANASPTTYIKINTLTKEVNPVEYEKLKNLVTVIIKENTTCSEKQDVEYNWKMYDFVRNNIKYVTTHHEVFEEYLRRSLEELIEDGVDYVELRTNFDELHGLPENKKVNGTEVADKILMLARSLIGPTQFSSIRIIYTPNRNEANVFSKFQKYQLQLGTFMAGFDYEGREVDKYPLKQSNDVLNNICEFYKRLQITAGNSITAGTVEDENLMEAILVGPDKINGGISILHHPYAIKLAKEKGITFVIDPIKYQLLGYGKSMKNHPISAMMGSGLNVVVAGGAPGMFGGKGVSHNYYYAMKATGGKYGGIKKIKKLIRHGLIHNRMTTEERNGSVNKWHLKWKKQCRYLSGKKVRDVMGG